MFTTNRVQAAPVQLARRHEQVRQAVQRPDRTTGGASQVNYGVIELANTGDLDYLLDYGFAGMPYTIKMGDDAAALSAFFRSAITIFAPSEASRRAKALPSPMAPPVMTAVRPFSLPSIFDLLFDLAPSARVTCGAR